MMKKFYFLFLTVVLQLLVLPSLITLPFSMRGVLVSASSMDGPNDFFTSFGRIRELSPQTFSTFLENSHKPTFILFYAPWCGHCQKFKEEYIRFASEVAGTARIGAVNADRFPVLGNEFNVKGFPTLIYWNLGNKRKSEFEVFNGARTSSALRHFLISRISKTKPRVQRVENTEALRKVIESSPLSSAAVFFSLRTSPPPMLTVLAASKKLRDIPFVFINNEHSEAMGKEFNISSFPTVAMIATVNQSDELHVKQYPEQRFQYEDVAQFIFRILNFRKGNTAEDNGERDN